MKYFLILLLFFSFHAYSEVLRDIVLIGNKKTTKNAIIGHAQIKINQNITTEELQTIKENIMRINQIHLKKYEFNNGILTIEIEDKWTLFPVPMITQSGNYNNRGFLIYDDNFLGTLGTFVPGISWSNSVINGLVYFQDESFFTPKTGFKVLVMRKSDYVDFKRNSISKDQYSSLYDTMMLLPNYLYKNQVFKAGPIYISKSITPQINKTISKDVSKGLFFRHHWNSYQTLEVMYQGFITTYDLYILKSQNGFWVNRQEADIAISIPYKWNFINLGLHGHLISDKSSLFSKILGGDEGYRGYDKSSLSASQNIGTLVQYQQHIFDKVFISPFYEYNNSILISSIMNGKTLSEHTVGIGIRYYFTKISIPGVTLDVARNLSDRSTHYHINIGVNI
jgi:hypothetical protein